MDLSSRGCVEDSVGRIYELVLHGFTESLRRELEQTRVTVLELVTPGVDTEMMTQVQEDPAEGRPRSGYTAGL
jgi:short-subunit dehydrogenase involved in D-alanine esterification of teichoic acids